MTKEKGGRRKKGILRWKGWAAGQMLQRSQGLGLGLGREKAFEEVRSMEAEREVGRRSCVTLSGLLGVGSLDWTWPTSPDVPEMGKEAKHNQKLRMEMSRVREAPGLAPVPGFTSTLPPPFSGQQGALPLAEPQCETERRGRHGAAAPDH